MIEIQSLSFGYDKGLVLQDLNATIKKNEFIAIIGPNGGGKSTFLKLLAGFLKPSFGKITIYSNKNAFPQISYVPQITNFDKDFPITTFSVVLGGAVGNLNWLGQYKKTDKQKAIDCLEQMDLLAFKDHPFGDLSGGQAQRALIARALMNQPDILILDEPTASCDKDAKNKIHEILTKLKGSTTIFLVTHETPGLIPVADRVFCIQKTLIEMDKAKVCGHFAFGVYHEQ